MHFGSILLTASTAVLAVAASSTEKKKRVSKFQWFGKKPKTDIKFSDPYQKDHGG